MKTDPAPGPSVTRARLTWMAVVLVAVAGGSWVLVVGFDVPATVAARAGCGGGVGVALGFLLPLLLPKRGVEGSFARAVGSTPEREEEVPASLRDFEFACRFATMPTGAYDLHFRLRPVLAELAAHRLRSGHGVDLYTAPQTARVLLGEELWEVVRPERPVPDDKKGPGLSSAALKEMVSRLETL